MIKQILSKPQLILSLQTAAGDCELLSFFWVLLIIEIACSVIKQTVSPGFTQESLVIMCLWFQSMTRCGDRKSIEILIHLCPSCWCLLQYFGWNKILHLLVMELNIIKKMGVCCSVTIMYELLQNNLLIKNTPLTTEMLELW